MYGSVTRARIFGVPILLVIVLTIYAISYYIMMYRRFGRSIYAIGSNPVVAHLSGIKIANVKVKFYGLAGALAAMAAMLYIARMGSVEMTIGSDTAISAIAAATIGGIGMRGGGKRGRSWRCPTCSAIHDRDMNVAKNIQRVGVRPRSGANFPLLREKT